MATVGETQKDQWTKEDQIIHQLILEIRHIRQRLALKLGKEV